MPSWMVRSKGGEGEGEAMMGVLSFFIFLLLLLGVLWLFGFFGSRALDKLRWWRSHRSSSKQPASRVESPHARFVPQDEARIAGHNLNSFSPYQTTPSKNLRPGMVGFRGFGV